MFRITDVIFRGAGDEQQQLGARGQACARKAGVVGQPAERLQKGIGFWIRHVRRLRGSQAAVNAPLGTGKGGRSGAREKKFRGIGSAARRAFGDGTGNGRGKIFGRVLRAGEGKPASEFVTNFLPRGNFFAFARAGDGKDRPTRPEFFRGKTFSSAIRVVRLSYG